MTPTIRRQVFAQCKKELADNGVTLSRAQRRAMAKLEKHKPRHRHVSKTGGLGILAKHYVNNTPIEDEKRTGAIADYYAALDALIGGRAEAVHADVLIYAVNIAYLLTELDPDLGKEHRTPLIKPALEALHRMNARNEKFGKYGLDAEGLQALRNFAELHELQLEWASQGEIDASIQEMHKRVESGWTFTFEEDE